MQRVGLIGHPVAHSVSPLFQQAAFDATGLKARYEAWDTLEAGLEQRLASLRGDDILGANVTVPFKEMVQPYLDEIDPVAARIGSVNTIVNHGGRLHGYNTDADGFALGCEDADIDLGLRPAVVVGAGGAARAVVYALTETDPRSVLVLNRTVERAREIAVEFGAGCDSLADAPTSVFQTARLVVNATSVGMRHGPPGMPFDPALLTSGCSVVDLVANPLQTELMIEAERAGCWVQGGLHMLVYQGAAAFELWTELEAPVRLMLETALRATLDQADES
ncbi:MAG: shikimate dehydrogenase [Dehalococcoidia bacterium]